MVLPGRYQPHPFDSPHQQMDARTGFDSELGEGRVRVNKLINFEETGSNRLMSVF